MGLTTAMYTGLTGLNVNQTRIETIGNNIANVNTNAFRASRTLFQTQFAQTLSMGTAPGAVTGGTNPMQIGHGALVATTQRTSNGGSLETTGLNTDLAVEGNGYFVVRDGNGRPYYTRDGAFTLNATNQLVNANGYRLRGFGVDASGNIIPGALQDIQVPLGLQATAHATENVLLDGDLSAASTRATTGSVTTTQALVTGIGTPATSDALLADLRATSDPNVVLFNDGDTITVSGLTRGGRQMPDQQFVIGTDGRTLGDFAAWLERTAGIQTTDGLPGNPGVTVENGTLVIRSNAGKPNAIQIANDDVRSSNTGHPQPFQFTQTTPADGDGVFTSFTVYDSLGNSVPVSATFVLDDTPNTGPVWRYYLESDEPGQAPQLLGSGTVTFDNDGNYVSAAGNQFTIDRSNTGATTPLSFTLNLQTLNGLSTQTSDVIMLVQDGFPPGTLSGFAIGTDGVVTGIFTNGLSQTLGQVALATFTNETGLVAESDNLFSAGPNSGPAAVTAPGSLSAGQIRAGALEMSNVDLSREFIGLITSSTAFQAASRVISTSNEMLDQLMMTLR
jgi:flagellar hook protein FlgE